MKYPTKQLISLLGLMSFIYSASSKVIDVPALPFPQIEVNAHIDRPVDLAFDAQEQHIISVSDDRTIRKWDQQTGRLISTTRIPIAEGKEGQLYSVAVASESRQLVVGGWTGYSWDKSISLYVFNIDTMKMERRVTGLHERVTALEFSPTEHRLAAALIDGTTIMYNAKDLSIIAQKNHCTANSYRIDFDDNNRLAVQCFDQHFYIYDENLELLDRQQPWKGHEIGSIQWSPDNSKLAIAYFDKKRVSILDGTSFALLKDLDVSSLGDETISQVTWSTDGRYVYAAGDYKKDGMNRIARWDIGKNSTLKTFPLSKERIFRLIPLPDGGIAYTSLEQAIAKISQNGSIEFNKAPPIVSHYNRDHLLHISANADTVSFALNDEGTKFQEFSVKDRKTKLADAPSPLLFKPIHSTPSMQIKNWRLSSKAIYNGKPLKFYNHQESNALAISPTKDFFALGLDSELRRYNKKGDIVWKQFIVTSVVSLNISQNGETIVAGLQDGSIRWYRASDGGEFFALFPHKNTTDWVAWTPPGFFIASPDGDKYIGWQLNNSSEETAEFYSAWQFEKLLYRPDIVQDYFDSQGVWNNSRQFEKFRTQRMRTLAPPKLEVSLLDVTNQGTAIIRIESEKRRLPIDQYTVFVNDLPVTPFNERQLTNNEQNAFIREHEIPLHAEENYIRVEAMTQSSFQVANLFIESKTQQREQKGDLYLLAIGVNELSSMPENSLNFAAQDAVAVSNLLKTSQYQYKKTHTKILSDLEGETPSKKNILESLSFLNQSTANDTVILYIAAHGISNKAGDYFMVPSDGNLSDLVGVIENNQRDADSLIRWDSFLEGMRNSAGRRMLIVDTCEAQKIKGNFDFGSLAKRSAAVSFGLLSASTGSEQSQEYPPAGQGLFTYALLQALEGKADENKDDKINLQEIYTYTKTFVEKNRLLRDLPQTPQLLASKSIRETSLNTLSENTIETPNIEHYIRKSSEAIKDMFDFFKQKLDTSTS